MRCDNLRADGRSRWTTDGVRVNSSGRKPAGWMGWLLLLWAGLCPAQGESPSRVGYLVAGAPTSEPSPHRACTPAMLARMDRSVEIPAPPGGWSGEPQAVNVFNVFAGEVMVRYGEREVCGRMHDARTRDSRFRAGVGMVVVPKRGGREPIRVAWTAPLKEGWIPTVHIGAPSPVQQLDTARLLVRTSCIAIAITLALMALLGFLTTRDRAFLGYTLLCVLSVLGQSIISGLSGYPEPWLPVCGNEWRWVVVFSCLGLSAMALCMWLLAGGWRRWPGWQRRLPWLCLAVCAIASLAVWLQLPALAVLADAIGVAFVAACALVLAQGLLSLRGGYPGAFAGIAVVLPFLAMAAMDRAHNRLLIEYRVEAMQAAITWFLTVSAYAINLRLGALRRQRDEMRALVDIDALTGLSNRRAGLKRLEAHLQSARASGAPLAVGFLDIDLFKRINDAYGHAVGDRVLVTVAQALQKSVRDPADVIRMGGEEFLLLLPGVGAAAARERLETMRKRVASTGLAMDLPDLEVSASIGLTVLEDTDTDATSLLRRADAAMYRAKHAGRNRVEEARFALDGGF